MLLYYFEVIFKLKTQNTFLIIPLIICNETIGEIKYHLANTLSESKVINKNLTHAL